MPAQSSTAAAQRGFAKNMTLISEDEEVLDEACRPGVNRLRACVGIRQIVVLWLRDLMEWVQGISLQERGPDGSERREGLVGYGSVGLVVYLVVIGLVSCSASLGL